MTSSEAQTHLDAWKAADLAVANGQSYNIGGRSLTRVDADTIRSQIQYYEMRLEAAKAAEAGSRHGRFVFARWN